jgi:hypothetical protein
MERPKLHDATLVRVVLLWDEQAEAEMEFRVDGPKSISLKASGVTNLSCPHENPWGPSVSVNEVRGPVEVRGGLQRIEIEIQSGDTIAVEARTFEWIQSE